MMDLTNFGNAFRWPLAAAALGGIPADMDDLLSMTGAIVSDRFLVTTAYDGLLAGRPFSVAWLSDSRVVVEFDKPGQYFVSGDDGLFEHTMDFLERLLPSVQPV